MLIEVIVPQIRAYNRIAIYISFFSLFAVALIAERLRPAFVTHGWSRVLFLAIIVGGTALGLLDQIPGVVRPDYAKEKEAFADEAEYVRKLETIVDRGARIFELPYADYPEGTLGYRHFKLYLHSRHIHVSYGASRGSKSDFWQKEVSAKPLPEMVEALRREGFAGIHVDSSLAPEDREIPAADLERVLGPAVLVGNQGRWAFYRIPPPK